MQDRYTGDIGDFGKYGLLKQLAGNDLKLGVVWCLVENEKKTKDGKFIEYLNKDKRGLKNCDPVLYEKLERLVRNKARKVANIKRLKVLPKGTRFFDHKLPASGDDRRFWLDEAFQEMKDRDLVFFDPDNGVASGKTGRPVKYVFLDEVQKFQRAGKSLVIYHHLDRSAPAAKQAATLLRPFGRDAFAFWYHRGTARFFLVVPSPGHQAVLRKRTKEMTASRWFEDKHFTLIPGN